MLKVEVEVEIYNINYKLIKNHLVLDFSAITYNLKS